LQWAQTFSTEVDSDDNELTAESDFGNDFSCCLFERLPLDDVLGFTGFTVSLSLNDLPCEDDVFEVEDCEVVIFKFVCGVG
jgi:hypothetical protein